MRQLAGNPYGLPIGSDGNGAGVSSEVAPRIVRDFDPENQWKPDGLVPVGVDGSLTANAKSYELPNSRSSSALPPNSTPLSAADGKQQAQTLSKHSDQLYSAAEYAKNQGLPDFAVQYQQAAYQTATQAQQAALQALNMNAASLANAPSSNYSPFSSGWNDGNYSAGSPFTTSSAEDSISANVTLQIRVGGNIGIDPLGIYGEVGLAFDLKSYGLHFYGVAGSVVDPQAVGAVSLVGSISQGSPAPGVANYSGLTYFGGEGLGGNATVLQDTESGAIGAGRGVTKGALTIGGGGGAGLINIRQWTSPSTSSVLKKLVPWR